MANFIEDIEIFLDEVNSITITDLDKFLGLLHNIKIFLESNDKSGNETYTKISALIDFYAPLNSTIIRPKDLVALKSYIKSLKYYFKDSKPDKRELPSTANPKKVFIVHGRDTVFKEQFELFLEKCGIISIPWSDMVEKTGKASPYIGEILEEGFSMAQAVIVLFTPDDNVILREKFFKPDEPEYEMRVMGQARPNVLFEAGYAFASHPDRTLLVQVGDIKPFTDIAGRHLVKLDNSEYSRTQIHKRLKTAGCKIDLQVGWENTGDFSIINGNNIDSKVFGKIKSDLTKVTVKKSKEKVFGLNVLKSDLLKEDKGYIIVKAKIQDLHNNFTGRNQYILSISENPHEYAHGGSYPNSWAILRRTPKQSKAVGDYSFWFTNENGFTTEIVKKLNLEIGWHFFTVTWDKNQNRVDFYIDDNIVGRNSISYWPKRFYHDFTLAGWPSNKPTFKFDSEVEIFAFKKQYLNDKQIQKMIRN